MAAKSTLGETRYRYDVVFVEDGHGEFVREVRGKEFVVVREAGAYEWIVPAGQDWRAKPYSMATLKRVWHKRVTKTATRKYAYPTPALAQKSFVARQWRRLARAQDEEESARFGLAFARQGGWPGSGA